MSKLLTRLELSVLNAEAERGSDAIADRTLLALESIADEFMEHLAAEREEDELPVLFDTVQRAEWADVLAECDRALKRGPVKKARKAAVHRVTKGRSSPKGTS